MDAKAGVSDRVANANVVNGRVNLLLLSLVSKSFRCNAVQQSGIPTDIKWSKCISLSKTKCHPLVNSWNIFKRH